MVGPVWDRDDKFLKPSVCFQFSSLFLGGLGFVKHVHGPHEWAHATTVPISDLALEHEYLVASLL